MLYTTLNRIREQGPCANEAQPGEWCALVDWAPIAEEA